MDKLQAWTTGAVVLSRPEPEGGGWLAVEQMTAPVMEQRDRVGRHAANTLFGAASTPFPEQHATTNRLLTDEQLWLVYKRTPDVRAAIDAIVRRVATWDWVVEPTLAPSDPVYQSTMEEAAAATVFLQAPNTDGETWQELWTKTILDLMIFDAGVIENVFAGTPDGAGGLRPTRDAELEELVALRGSTVIPVVDQHGHLLGYRQSISGFLTPTVVVQGEPTEQDVRPTFAPDQIVYLRLFPNTASPLGVPLIDTLVNEIITVLRSSEHSMLAFDADEIPPGILVLTGIAGKAAQSAKADLQTLRGKDHKVRVITNPDPKATGAHWVELRHTAKDVDFVNVVNQVRRTIWRVFGVLPVEMGASEDIPRAVGQVQLEVAGSHLINPILELIEAKINARILPLVVDDPAATSRLRFRFDRESKLSAEDQQKMANTLSALVREGLMTRNEARAIRGDPPVVGGDVVTLTTGQGVFPLTTIVGQDGGTGTPTSGGSGTPPQTPPDTPPETPPDAGPGDVTAPSDRSTTGVNMTPPQGVQRECQRGVDWYEDGHGGRGLRPETVRWARRLARGEDITAEKVKLMRAWLARHEVDKQGEGFNPGEDGYPSPGRVAWALWGGDPAVPWSNKLMEQLERNEGSALRALLTDPDLPSAWQSSGPFRGKRTLDLPALHDVVSDYTRAVTPLYDKAADEAVAAVRSEYRPGQLDDDGANRLLKRINDSIDKLQRDWSIAVDSQYQRATQIGVQAARDWSGQAVLSDWRERGAQYGERAMQYLIDDTGLLTDLRARMIAIVTALTSDLEVERTRNANPGRRPDGLSADVSVEEAGDAMTAAWSAEKQRIKNWSGRLVELSNDTMLAGLAAAASSVEDGQVRPAEWMVDWVHVSDRRTCATCEQQGSLPIRPLDSLPTTPGGDTECRARCRCVLVLWTRAEVDSGEAISFGPLD